MKRTVFALVLTALATSGIVALAQTAIQRDPITGAHMVQGALINSMIDAINSIQGTSGAAGNISVAGGGLSVGGNLGIMCATAMPTTATDAVFYIATRPVRVRQVSEVHAVAAGGASALQVTKDTGTTAPGAGTDLLTNNTNTGFDMNATANTVQVGTLTATVASLTLAAGDRLAYDFANAIQSSAGIAITVCMSPQ